MQPALPAAIGPYRVVRELGRGGMGVVYEVQDPQARRALALKQVLAEAATPEALVRFEREAEMLGRIRHPNVVAVHALGRSPAGPYLVTELVAGRGLDVLAREAPLPPRRAAELVRTLADAVAALHAQGLLHRDLKPQNVLVRADGAPVLLDFGLAREIDGASLTRSGSVLGTPAYMSPEQAESPRGLDARADVYALGAVLFELLAGRPPFDGTPVEVLYRVLHAEPTWPRATRPDVPADLEAICRAAMHKDLEARTPTAAHLRADLERWLRGERPLAAGRMPRGRGGVALAVVAVALVALAALVRAFRGPPGGSGAAPVATSRPSGSAATTSTPTPASAGSVPAADAAAIVAYRAAATPPPQGLRAVVSPWPASKGPWSTLAAFLDDHTVVIARSQFPTAVDVRRVSLGASVPDAIWTGLEHGPRAAVSPVDDWLRGLTVLRGAGPPRAVLAGCTQTACLVDVATPAGGLLREPVWTVPDAWLDGARSVLTPATFDVSALAAAPDGRTVAIGGDWRVVWVVDLVTRQTHELAADPGETADVVDLAFSRDGRLLALVRSRVGEDVADPVTAHYWPWRVEVWRLPGTAGGSPERVAVRSELAAPGRPRAVAWTAAGLLVVGHDGGDVSTWRVADHEVLERVAGVKIPATHTDGLLDPGSDVVDVAMAANGRTLLAVADQRLVVITVDDAGALALAQPFDLLPSPATSVDVSPDEALVVVGDADGAVTVRGVRAR